MARLVLSLLVLLSFTIYFAESASSPTDFIKTSCKATLYPDLCVECLSGYASAIQHSEKHLGLTALAVSLSRTRSVAVFVSKMSRVRGITPREQRAVRDCIENMGDSVDRLSQSVKELGRTGRAIGGQEFTWHMSNVQTWVSAALTDDNTCIDGFAGRTVDGNVKAAIKRRVVNAAKVTSNALALINRFASRHKTSTASGEIP